MTDQPTDSLQVLTELYEASTQGRWTLDERGQFPIRSIDDAKWITKSHNLFPALKEQMEQQRVRAEVFKLRWEQGKAGAINREYIHDEAYKRMWKRVDEAEVENVSLRSEVEKLQAAVDEVANALHSAAYVGGPTEREAWQRALAAVNPLHTQHVAANPDVLAESQEKE